MWTPDEGRLPLNEGAAAFSTCGSFWPQVILEDCLETRCIRTVWDCNETQNKEQKRTKTNEKERIERRAGTVALALKDKPKTRTSLTRLDLFGSLIVGLSERKGRLNVNPNPLCLLLTNPDKRLPWPHRVPPGQRRSIFFSGTLEAHQRSGVVHSRTDPSATSQTITGPRASRCVSRIASFAAGLRGPAKASPL